MKSNDATLAVARFPTGLQIDLRGRAGNIFYILGTCYRIADTLGLSPALKAEFKAETCLDSGKNYQQILDICQQWFGLIYIRRNG